MLPPNAPARNASVDGLVSEPKPLEVAIPYTSLTQVQHSVRSVERLCCDLNAEIRVVRVVVVPYPLELDHPRVALSHLHHEARGLRSSLPLTFDIRLCRDFAFGFKAAIAKDTPVALTTERRLWPTREMKLARELRAAGYHVSLFHKEKNHA